MGFVDWIKGLQGTPTYLGADDIVVFVVGPSGSGKSLFIEQVTRSDLIKVGTSLRPCTANVQAIKCELTDDARKTLGRGSQKNIVFVDTPSFHTGGNDYAAEKEMKSWLTKSQFKSTLVGVIYMHRIETDPVHESIQQHLDTFTQTFPQGFVSLPQRLYAVLSYEGVMPEDTIRQRKATFRAQLHALRPSLDGRLRWITSSHPELFKPYDSETAWQAVVALFSLVHASQK